MKDISEKDIILFQKLSIIQYLLRKDWTFLNKKDEIVFDLFTNDKKISVQNSIGITKTHDFIIYTCFPILKDFIHYKQLLSISNYINEFSGVFNTYTQEIKDGEYNLFFVKKIINLFSDMVIGDEFWDFQLKTQIDNVSTIADFLYFKFPKSKYYKEQELDGQQEFKLELYNSIQSYLDSIKILRRDNSKIDSLSKEELEEELGKEFEYFVTGKKDLKNTFRLNLIVNALQKFNDIK